MKRGIIYLFAFIGMLITLIAIINFFKENKEAKKYWENCQEVKVGMTLEQAKLIMGDLGYNNRTRSEIWTYFNNDTIKEYYLTYPPVFGGSSSPEIHFDPNTQRVTKVICGE